jgi:hypothetical protein
MLRFNSPYLLQETLSGPIPKKIQNIIKDKAPSSAEEFDNWLRSCQYLSRLSAQNLDNLQSQQISAEVQRYLLSSECFGKSILGNGNSIYPDLIRSDVDYNFLPFQNRNQIIHGPCLKNKKKPKPSNVPDGCEIKTNKSKTVRVDAHGAHPGLHLAFTWEYYGNKINILDIWIAYIRISDHTISDGNVDVTTKKRSFGHSPFLSILRGEK